MTITTHKQYSGKREWSDQIIAYSSYVQEKCTTFTIQQKSIILI